MVTLEGAVTIHGNTGGGSNCIHGNAGGTVTVSTVTLGEDRCCILALTSVFHDARLLLLFVKKRIPWVYVFM